MGHCSYRGFEQVVACGGGFGGFIGCIDRAIDGLFQLLCHGNQLQWRNPLQGLMDSCELYDFKQ